MKSELDYKSISKIVSIKGNRLGYTNFCLLKTFSMFLLHYSREYNMENIEERIEYINDGLLKRPHHDGLIWPEIIKKFELFNVKPKFKNFTASYIRHIANNNGFYYNKNHLLIWLYYEHIDCRPCPELKQTLYGIYEMVPNPIRLTHLEDINLMYQMNDLH